jgi:hypothetical protein
LKLGQTGETPSLGFCCDRGHLCPFLNVMNVMNVMNVTTVR